MSKNVIIIGAGGHAKVIADIVKKSNDNLIGFLDDNDELQGKVIYDNKVVIGKICNALDNNNCFFIVGIGNNKIRKKIAEKYNLNWYTAIHPNAIIANEVEIGDGTAIMAGSIINTGTKVGRHCIINTSSSLDHDNILEDYVHISPGAHLAGNVIVKTETWICLGAIVINNITIEKNNIIGAGTVVVRNINEENGTFVGVPSHKVVKL